jgi:RNA polymerase sigma-70 factor (ECF subfamily)
MRRGTAQAVEWGGRQHGRNERGLALVSGGDDVGAGREDSVALAAEDADSGRLVLLAQRGDAPSFDVLHARYRARVYAYVLGKLGDPFEAEDVTQEVFSGARRTLSTYRAWGATPWRAWLFAVAHNRVVERLGARADVDLVEPLELNLRRELRGAAPAAPAGPGWIDDHELLALFERLPLAQRQVLTLRFALDRSVAETAAILERTVTDVTTLQHRALTVLRRAPRGLPRPERAPRRERARQEAFMRRRPTFSPVLSRRRLALALSL